MHGALSHRPGYAVVPRLELGVVRLAVPLRGNQRPDHGDSALPWDDRFHESGVVVPAMPLPRSGSSGEPGGAIAFVQIRALHWPRVIWWTPGALRR